MVAVATMIYKKDHAPTDPSQQPLISDSTETNHNLLAPPIPTNPLHLAAAVVLMLPPFPNMETAEQKNLDVWWPWQQQPPWMMKTVMTVMMKID